MFFPGAQLPEVLPVCENHVLCGLQCFPCLPHHSCCYSLPSEVSDERINKQQYLRTTLSVTLPTVCEAQLLQMLLESSYLIYYKTFTL